MRRVAHIAGRKAGLGASKQNRLPLIPLSWFLSFSHALM